MKSEYKRIITQASEEALATLILKNLDWSGGNDDANGAFLTSILLEHRAQAQRAEVVPQWISVKERLPMDSERVLVLCADGEIFIRFRLTGNWFDKYYGQMTGNYTHWMPRPGAPV